MDCEFIRETSILNMHTNEWSTLEFVGPHLPGIYNFASCMTDEGDLYVFGGTEEPLNQNKKLYRIREIKAGETDQYLVQIQRSNRQPTITFN